MDLIQKFNEYFDKIEESLNSPQPIEWDSNSDSHIGHFSVDGEEYKIEFLKQIGNNWCYLFAWYDKEKEIWTYEISQRGLGGFKVLSTVKNGLYEMYKKIDPNSIIFSALDSSDTRKRLYQSFCEEFANINNLSFSNRGSENYQMFLMFKKELTVPEKEEIMLSVRKVTEIGK